MKKIFVILLTVVSASVFAKQHCSQIKVLSQASDIFYFKVDKDLIGAEVEIFAWDGEMLGSQTINKKRTLIDFYSLEPGEYTILIVKDGVEQEFKYEKE